MPPEVCPLGRQYKNLRLSTHFRTWSLWRNGKRTFSQSAKKSDGRLNNEKSIFIFDEPKRVYFRLVANCSFVEHELASSDFSLKKPENKNWTNIRY
jgi:hypothetical protein